jgi:nucleoid DNA-binding protein
MAAQPLTATEFIDGIAEQLDGEYSKSDVKKVLVAVAAELQDSLANGYKVNITGIGRFEPRAKAGPKKVTADEPTKVVVKAFPAAALKNGMPGAKTKKGQDLAAALLKK